MAVRTMVLQAENGLHLRPAAEFVTLAKGFDADIVVSVGGKSANGKSLFNLQTLGLTKGMEVCIEASGNDADEAVAALAGFILSLT